MAMACCCGRYSKVRDRAKGPRGEKISSTWATRSGADSDASTGPSMQLTSFSVFDFQSRDRSRHDTHGWAQEPADDWDGGEKQEPAAATHRAPSVPSSN